MHYLTGHETTVRRIHHRLGFVWNRTTPGWGNPIELCFPRLQETAGVCDLYSWHAAAPVRKLMTSIAAGGIRAATAGVRLCTATCLRLRTMCARIG